MELPILVVLVFSILGLLAVFLILIWIGFRMGRMSADKPISPIIQPKVVPMINEDPYHELMTGEQQKRIPTVEG